MKTVNASISVGQTAQVSDGTTITTVQVLNGFLRVYVGDAAPTTGDHYMLMTAGDVLPMAANVKSWVTGKGDYAVVSVEST